MASPSSQRGAARAPPTPDEFAAFYKLVDKKLKAGQLCRYARNAELSAQAAVQAVALFGDDSLVVASLLYSESESFAFLSTAATRAETEALLRRSFAVLLLLIPLLLRRHEANTLLPGTIRDEEVAYAAHAQATMKKAKNEPVPPPDELHAWASTTGYNILMNTVFRSLDLLKHSLWPQHQRKMVESFVFQGLDVIPRTAGMPAHLLIGEERVVMMIEKHVSPRNYDPTFCAAVLRKWRSDAVSSVLRARSVLQTGIARYMQTGAEFEARQRDDIAKHGLRDCALPSCSKTEKTVKEFAHCSGCCSVVYCCLEHQALDWTKHKKACRAKQAAWMAEEEAEQGPEEGAGGGAGAA